MQIVAYTCKKKRLQIVLETFDAIPQLSSSACLWFWNVQEIYETFISVLLIKGGFNYGNVWAGYW